MFRFSTLGILASVLACVKIRQMSRLQNNASGDPVSRDKGIFVIGRDSHKSVFDAIALAECDVILLPCYSDAEFGVSLGSSFTAVELALKMHPGKVFHSMAWLFT